MVKAGLRQQLQVTRIDRRGAWLDGGETEILLPSKECPSDLTTGSTLEVFIFSDRHGALLATRREVAVQIGEFAMLQVSSVAPAGAFLDWGLEKDLLCPFSEQPQRMLEGRRYLVRACHDQEGRPIASARLEKFLEKENCDLRAGDEVDVLIWAFTELGARVIVNNRYEALIYKNELPPGLTRGDRCKGFVGRLRDDRRLDISLRRPGAAGVADARQTILAALQPSGFLPLHDLSPPEQIRQRLGLSKKLFKKAVGGLYKEGLVELTAKGIKLLKKP